MARFEFRLPDIGEGIAEAEIVGWHVKPGDVVAEDAPIADVMTDKATVELSAPVTGTVLETNGAVGEKVAIGSILVVFETGQEAMAAEKQSPQQEIPSGEEPPDEDHAAAIGTDRMDAVRVQASPAVRQRAKDLGVDLALVRPGAGGRIRHGDLDAYLRYLGAFAGPSADRSTDMVEEVPVIGLRRRIAENVAASKRNIPHFTYVEEVDVTELEALRAAMNAGRGDHSRLTLLPFIIKAMTHSLPQFPMINARYDDEANVISRHSSVHAGIATQTDNGLTVPVIRDAQMHDIWALAAEITRLAAAVRSGKAGREELSGSTITVTSLGLLGGIVSTPVINRPEVAIVGINRIVERPAVVNGRIEVRKLMNLSSSFDHRVIDGWDAASFIQAVKQLIETPALMFTDMLKMNDKS